LNLYELSPSSFYSLFTLFTARPRPILIFLFSLFFANWPRLFFFSFTVGPTADCLTGPRFIFLLFLTVGPVSFFFLPLGQQHRPSSLFSCIRQMPSRSVLTQMKACDTVYLLSELFITLMPLDYYKISANMLGLVLLFQQLRQMISSIPFFTAL
jgi:hypothetical protein